MRHLYYDRHGREVDATIALTADKTLRDGYSVRVAKQFRDSALTDGSGNCSELAFSRPGWRMLADGSVNDARETAYAEYLADLTTAWRRGAVIRK